MADTHKDRQGEPSMPSHETHPFVDRFRMIRESMPSTAAKKTTPNPIQEFTTHAVELVRQSCRKNSNLPPPPYIIDDLFQADIDSAFGEGTSIFIDRSCVYISPQGDVGFLAGPAALDRLVFAAVPEPVQYIFRVDKSRKGIDGLGAWSLASATLPPIERHEAIYERLADNVKDVAEGPVKCIPIVFRGFSDKAREKLLELALPQRTLPPVDVLLEDGVTILSRLKDNEEEPEWEGAITPPSPASPSRERHRTDEEEEEGEEVEEGDVPLGNEQSDELGRDNTETNRPLQINYDIPPAPMPSPVDPSVFVGFDPVLPPEPDTPSDNAKSPKTPSTSKPEDQQSHQTAQISSPSAIRALFSPSNGVQSKYESRGIQTEDSPASGNDTKERNEFGRNSVQNARPELAIPERVRSDTVTDPPRSSLPGPSAPASSFNLEAVSGPPSTDPGLQSTSGADLQTLITMIAFSFGALMIEALAARTPPEEPPSSTIAAQDDAAADAPPQSLAHTDGTATGAPSLDTPEPPVAGALDESRFANVPHIPVQASPLSEQELHPESIEQGSNMSSQQAPGIRLPTPRVEDELPNEDSTSGSSVSSEAEAVQGLRPPVLEGPATPAGNRRSRPSPTPPSAEAQRNPHKRLREERDGEEGDVEEGLQTPPPVPPPAFENESLQSRTPPTTQADSEASSTSVRLPTRNTESIEVDTPQDQPAVNVAGYPERVSLSEVIQSSARLASLPNPFIKQSEEADRTGQLSASSVTRIVAPEIQSAPFEAAQDSESDADTSMESASKSEPSGKGKGKATSQNISLDSRLVPSLPGNTESPPPMEWDPEGHSPHIPAASPRSWHAREGRAVEDMELELPGPVAPHLPKENTPSLSTPLASGSGVGQALMGRPIKPLRPARRGLGRAPVRTGHRSGNDVAMAVETVDPSVPTEDSIFGPASPMSGAAGPSMLSRIEPPSYGTPGDRRGSFIKPDPELPTSSLEPAHSKNTSEDIVMTGGPGIPNAFSRFPERTSPDGNAMKFDRYIRPMPEVTDSGLPDRSDEQSFASALPENQPETSDDGSDFTDDLQEAKASNYSTSNAIAAAAIENEVEEPPDSAIENEVEEAPDSAIENEVEEASDSEGRTPTPPVHPAEFGAPRLHASTHAFGLHSARSGNAGASSVARLGDLSSTFSAWSISGPSNIGGSTDASPTNGEERSDQNSTGGATDDGEEEEDIFPLI